MTRAICRLTLRQASVVVALVLSAARSSSAAGPVAAAPAFRLSSCPTCSQENPKIAGTPSGKLAAAFDIRLLGQSPIVQARVFPAAGAAGVPFRPQVADLPFQYDASVAGNATGAFVVGWSTTNPATHNSDVWAQRYDATGKAAGPRIAVNIDGSGLIALDTLPTVAMGTDGGFTVTWIRAVPAGQPNPTGNQIWARRFAGTGVPAGAPVQVSTGLVDGTRPSACIDTVGRSVIVWATDNEAQPFEQSLLGVSMRRLTPKGAPIAGVVVVAAPKATESHPAVSCGLASSFVVTWETNQPPVVASTNVVAQRFSATAARVGGTFLVNPSPDKQRVPAIAHDAAGNFVVVWQLLSSATTGIYGQRFSSAAAKLGNGFTVALAGSPSRPLKTPAVTAAGAKNAFAVAWENPELGLFARRFKIVL